MADPVVIHLQLAGVAQIEQGLRSIDQGIMQLERRAGTTTQRGAEDRIRAAKKEATEREKLAAQVGKAGEKASKEETRAFESAEKQKTRELEREARRRQMIIDNSAKTAGRIAVQQANVEIAEARRVAEARRRYVEGMVGRAGSAAGRVVGGMGRAVVGAGMIGGGFAIADASRELLGLEKAAAAVSISGYIPGKNERMDPKLIMARARAAEAGTNIRSVDIAKGLQTYVAASSDLEGGMANLTGLAQLAKASGSDFGDIMKTAGMLRAQNENMTPVQMMDTMRNIIGQGKLGAVELPDLAAIASKVTASSAMYQGDQTTAQRRLLGLSQIAIKTAGNPEEAATAVTRLGSDIMMHQGQLRKMGLDVADAKTGLLKDPAEVLRMMFEKSGGNLGKLHAMGLGERSIKVAEALAPVYQNAFASAKAGGKSDAEATKIAGARVAGEVSKFTEAGYSKGDVDKDLQMVMKTSGERFESAMTKIRETLEDKLGPYLEKFADKLPELIPKIERIIEATARLADWFLDNPFKGIGAIILAAIAKDVAGAAIGSYLKSLIASSLSGGGAPGAGGAGGGALGAGGAGLLGGAGLTIAATSALAQAATAADIYTGGTSKADSDVAALVAKAKSGKATPEDLAAAQALAQQGEQGGGIGTALGLGQGVWAEKLSGGRIFKGAGKQAEDAVAASEIREKMPELKAAIAEMSRTIREGAGGAKGGMGAGGDPSRSAPQSSPSRGGLH